MTIYKITGENREVFADEKFLREIRCTSDGTDEDLARLLPKMTHRFKVLDDVGVTYFWGVCSDPNSFAPLDNVGEAYGCTEIQYMNEKTGEYETL